MPDSPSSLDHPVALQLAMACDLAEVRRAAGTVRRFLSARRCVESDLMDCELALVEACNNAVQYAAPEARHLPVGIEVMCRTQEIEMRVTDHTPGFDWPEHAPLPGAEHERGRGLYLIQSVMDDAHFSRHGAENVLVLRKRRADDRSTPFDPSRGKENR
jgi:anti-sigma regulatory factor (Ser/Thr protein kinase)